MSFVFLNCKKTWLVEPKWVQVQSSIDYLDLKRWKKTISIHLLPYNNRRAWIRWEGVEWQVKNYTHVGLSSLSLTSPLDSPTTHVCLASQSSRSRLFLFLNGSSQPASPASFLFPASNILWSDLESYFWAGWLLNRTTNLRLKGCLQHWVQLKPFTQLCAKLDSPVVFHTQLAPHHRNKPDAASASH